MPSLTPVDQTINTAELVRELKDSSLALLASLRERDPHFLEHLERREHAIVALKRLAVDECYLPLLEDAMLVGEAIAGEARHMRQDAVTGLSRQQSRRDYSRGLSSQAGHAAAALDVKA